MSDFPSAPPPMGMSSGTPATFAQRLIARLIDFGIIIGMLIPAFIVAFIVGAVSDVLGFLVALVLYLVIFAAAVWMIVGGIAKTGQTPGQRMQGVKVTSDTGELLGFGGAVIRWLVSALTNSILCGLPIGSLWMLFDAEKKTLYDKILNNRASSVAPGSLMPIFPDGNPF